MPERDWSSRGETPCVTWAIASRPMRGQAVSGDMATIQVTGARTVLAAIDGLGHGPEAASAARLAVEVIEHNPAEPLDVLLLLAHRELGESRGAAATVAIIDGERGTMGWLGVGNVDAVLVRADLEARPHSHGAFLVGGVLGHHMGKLHQLPPLPLDVGDLIVLATDGIRANLAEVVRLDVPLDRLAQTILEKYGRPDDDALVLVARYRPLGPSLDERSFYQPLGRQLEARPADAPYGPLGPSSSS